MARYKTLILNKDSVKSSYRYWDEYRYTYDENWRRAVTHYTHEDDRLLINVELFKNTVHARYLIEE